MVLYRTFLQTRAFCRKIRELQVMCEMYADIKEKKTFTYHTPIETAR